MTPPHWDDLPAWACSNCGFWQRWFAPGPPPHCPVCTDVRNALPSDGWHFRSADEVAGLLTCTRRPVVEGVTAHATSPRFGLDSVGWVLEEGVCVEAAGWYDDAGLAALRAAEVHTLVASHVHGYGALWRLQQELAPPVVAVGVDDLAWTKAFRVTLPLDPAGDPRDPAETVELAPGVRAHVSGGHFPGHVVVHHERRGLLFCGDLLKVDLDAAGRPQGLSAHKAFHAAIPLSRGELRRARALVETLDFEHVFTPFEHGEGITTRIVLALLDRLLVGPATAAAVPLAELAS